MKKYELIEHTADMGIKAYGSSQEELFENAALGLFNIIAEIKKVKSKERFDIILEEENIEELFVSWLRELLYQFNVNLLLFNNFTIRELTDKRLSAFAWGEKWDKNRHILKTEVKAVTYHNLKLEKKDKTWQAEVIFDV